MLGSGPARRAAGRRVELSVSDTGIPEHELPRLFERFHRIEGTRARTHEGSGIGLPLVSDLVKLHGGVISVQSQLDRGSTFRVSIPTGCAHLPAERIVAEDGAERQPPERSLAQQFVNEAARWLPSDDAPETVPLSRTLGPGRLLVADDNADMREYLARILRPHWHVDAVSDGRVALTAARDRRPDLIVTDVMMPTLDGFGLLRELHADPSLRDIPVIMLSARAGEEARIEGIAAGANDYLVKPFWARELVARVAARLELLRLGQRLADERAAIAHLFAQMPMPVAILRGPDQVFESANEAYLQVVGGRDIVGKPFLEALPEMAGQGFDELLREVLATGKAEVRREQLLRLERGGRLQDTYFTFLYSPVRGEDGHFDSVVALCNDVTEQVLARRRLEALAVELAQASRAKDEFLAMLARRPRPRARHRQEPGRAAWG